jgi:hypothetical protein
VAAARRVLFPIVLVVAALVAVHPVLGGVGQTTGGPAVGRSGTGLDLAALAVGDSATSHLTVANTGAASGTFVLGASPTGSGAVAGHLRVTVSCGSRTLYRGSLAGLAGTRLGVLAPGQARTYVVRVELASGGNELQGLRTNADLTVSAIGL